MILREAKPCLVHYALQTYLHCLMIIRRVFSFIIYYSANNANELVTDDFCGMILLFPTSKPRARCTRNLGVTIRAEVCSTN